MTLLVKARRMTLKTIAREMTLKVEVWGMTFNLTVSEVGAGLLLTHSVFDEVQKINNKGGGEGG